MEKSCSQTEVIAQEFCNVRKLLVPWASFFLLAMEKGENSFFCFFPHKIYVLISVVYFLEPSWNTTQAGVRVEPNELRTRVLFWELELNLFWHTRVTEIVWGFLIGWLHSESFPPRAYVPQKKVFFGTQSTICPFLVHFRTYLVHF